LYIVTSVLTGVVGFCYSVFIRVELATIGIGILLGDYQFYNVLISAHGLIMIFGFIMPISLGGFTNY